MTKFFMKRTTNGEWVQVHENDWEVEDIYIDDPFHHAECWGDCYKEDMFKDRRKI